MDLNRLQHMQMTQFGDSPSYSFAISLIQQ